VPDVRIELLGRFDVVVDGSVTGAGTLGRRQASGLLKLLALTPGRAMHRERLLDLLWPDDDIDEALPKLHKAAHFARRACDHVDAVVFRGDLVQLFPGVDIVVDAEHFEGLARRALELRDTASARMALTIYRGELLPQDRYEEWAEAPRNHLADLHLQLLRLAERWEELVVLDPGDEDAHLEVMRRHLAAGDRHAVLRQFERLDRALRNELGVAPSEEAKRLRAQALADEPAVPGRRDDAEAPFPGRERHVALIDDLLADAEAARERIVIVTGASGVGKSTLLSRWRRAAEQRGFRTAVGSAVPAEGSWPYAPITEAVADLCRRHPSLVERLDAPFREEIERVMASVPSPWSGVDAHQRLFVATAALFRLAAADGGLLLVLDDLHDADEATLRLVRHLVRALHGERAVLAFGMKAAPLAAAVVELSHSLRTRYGAVSVELGPLARSAVDALVHRRLPDAGDETVTRIAELSGGLPFAVAELTRRAAEDPDWERHADEDAVASFPPATLAALQRLAVLGATFDTDDVVAASGGDEGAAYERLDDALASGVIERTEFGYRFHHEIVRDAVLAALPAHRVRLVHREIGESLAAAGASPARVGHHFLESGDAPRAVPYLLDAAEGEAAIGAYRDALGLIERVRGDARGDERQRLLRLRADLLHAIGDVRAVAAYREALEQASPADARILRARMSRAALSAGDPDTAAAALSGLAATDRPEDTEILLAQANVAFYSGDTDAAWAIVESAQERVLAGERSWRVLDLIALQSLLAHNRGEWFDRIRSELRTAQTSPEVANAVFDGYLCTAEYLLYGPTPYRDVIELASGMRETAEQAGALRAVAFARALTGEAALLSGDLDLADEELTESAELHHELGSNAGEAHCLERLAELELYRGDRAAARRLLERALPLARWSVIAQHLLQRVYGSMVLAAEDADDAYAIIDRAEATLGREDSCRFCAIMFAVPAMIALSRVGDLDRARHYRDIAATSTQLWDGTAWQAALDEATAHLASAEGDADAARFAERGAREFERAGQPLDAARCEALAHELAPGAVVLP
jgi:DNA-binding SARP family transcriptional activator